MRKDVTVQLQQALQQGPVCVVEVVSSQGSVPREASTWMAVLPAAAGAQSSVLGSIGGGHLEWLAEQKAQAWLHAALAPAHLRLSLGPSLGQCCGGAVELRFERVTQAQAPAVLARLQQLAPARMPVALFGAGHVGTALVHVLQALPFEVYWVDSRDGMWPEGQDLAHVHCEHSEPPQAMVAQVPTGSRVLIMSHSHAEDLDIVVACLQRQRMHQDLPFIGLIGSATKWTVFQRRLRERGFTPAEIGAVTCPIGVPGVVGKEPAVIAVAVAAQLLQMRE